MFHLRTYSKGNSIPRPLIIYIYLISGRQAVGGGGDWKHLCMSTILINSNSSKSKFACMIAITTVPQKHQSAPHLLFRASDNGHSRSKKLWNRCIIGISDWVQQDIFLCISNSTLYWHPPPSPLSLLGSFSLMSNGGEWGLGVSSSSN